MRVRIAGVLMLALAGAANAATPPASLPVSLEVRLVVPCQPGDQALAVVGGGEELCLDKTAMLDASGVVKVERYPVLPKAVMQISDAASARFYDLTADKTGERVGFVFNGRLIFVPVIYQPVKTKELQISLKNDPDDIDALVAAFPGTAAAQ
jgi:hypothetical protein